MSKHYFVLCGGNNGVVLGVNPQIDLDTLTAPTDIVTKFHQQDDTSSLLEGVSRAWGGQLNFGKTPLSYVIMEPHDSRGELTLVVVGDLSQVTLEYRTERIMEMFRLREIPSKRLCFEEAIKLFVANPLV